MANKIYWSKTALTGGGATALDSIDGTGLTDGDIAHVTVSGVLYVYKLDEDSAAAESVPAIIAPDANAGDKRWIRQQQYVTHAGAFKMGTLEIDASGSKAITGVGFKPTLVLFNYATEVAAESSSGGMGWDDGTNAYCTYGMMGAAAGFGSSATLSIYADKGSSNTIEAKISSLDADGFTLNVSVFDSTDDLLVHYLAFR